PNEINPAEGLADAANDRMRGITPQLHVTGQYVYIVIIEKFEDRSGISVTRSIIGLQNLTGIALCLAQLCPFERSTAVIEQPELTGNFLFDRLCIPRKIDLACRCCLSLLTRIRQIQVITNA